MEELDKLPPIALAALGLGLALIFGVRYLGLMSGERSSPRGHPAAAQVAAVIVDPSALNKATEAVNSLTKTLDDSLDAQKDHTHMLCRQVKGLTEEVHELGRGITELRIEIAKSR